MEVIKYSTKYKEAWDAFVASSKNGTFLLHRSYMDYHADRFEDHSLLFYKKGKLVALFPANVAGSEVQSHAGLSYGGMVSGAGMKVQLMLEVFDTMTLYFRELGYGSINYKAIPHIYHQHSSEEDLYALFRHGATLYRRDLNTVIALQNRLPYSSIRSRKLRNREQHNLLLGPGNNIETFMQMQLALLEQKYNTRPVHTAEELNLLITRFPENIKLYTATLAGEMLAGILIFETATVAHCQYIASTSKGREMDALDFLLDLLITEVYAHKVYFSFGVSTEQQGKYLNPDLVRNKESYGARTVVQDFYSLNLLNK